jgi:hypothetical protein
VAPRLADDSKVLTLGDLEANMLLEAEMAQRQQVEAQFL